MGGDILFTSLEDIEMNDQDDESEETGGNPVIDYRDLETFSANGAPGLTPLDVFEHRQHLLRQVLDRLQALRLPSELDESYYDAIRAILLAAGAVAADIDAIATCLVRLVVERSDAGPEERETQFELIAQHLALTEMTVRINAANVVVRVEFPARPTTH